MESNYKKLTAKITKLEKGKMKKEEKIKEWRAILRTIVKKEAQKLVDSAGNRDFIGIEDGAHVKNIFTAYNRFNWKLNEQLPKEEEEERK